MAELDFGAGPIAVALRSFVVSSKRSTPARRSRTRPPQRDTTLAPKIDQRPEPLRVAERRRPTPSTPAGYLDELPARVLLDRLTMPVLAVGPDGVVIYANPECATLLGHDDPTTVKGHPLNWLLEGRADTTPSDCLTELKSVTAGAVTTWRHTDGFPVSTLVSRPLLRRDDDQVLLVAITDISDSLWRNETPNENAG